MPTLLPGAMPDTLSTRVSLLVRLRDPGDRAAWAQFVELYGSLVYGFVRQRGLQDADAADLTQEVFQAVAQVLGRWEYDRRRGTFRGWLYAITRNRLARFLHRRNSQPQGSGDTSANQRLGEEPDPGAEPDEGWEEEYRKHAFRLACERVRPAVAAATWEAFWRTAVEGQGASDVAAALGMSVGAVYVAKSRVMTRLAEEIRSMEAEDS
jgi:RNA polymerase sigma-70 factor (ECF subfamily)